MASYPQATEDGDAFIALYRMHVSAVYRYFYHQIGHVQDAEDLTSKTFFTALAVFDRYEAGRGSLAAWLFGVANNCLRDFQRGRPRPEPLPIVLPDPRPLPEWQLLSAERADALRRAIGKLPDDQRHALTLRFLGGLRNREVAEVLGRTEAAVKMLVHRAVMTLRDYPTCEDWR